MDQVELKLCLTREADGSYTGGLAGKMSDGREFSVRAPGHITAASAAHQTLHLLALHDECCGVPLGEPDQVLGEVGIAPDPAPDLTIVRLDGIDKSPGADRVSVCVEDGRITGVLIAAAHLADSGHCAAV